MQRTLRQLWHLDGEPLDVVAEALGTTVEQLPDELAELLDLGVLDLSGELLHLTPPRIALAQLLEKESATLEQTIERLQRMAGLVVRLGEEGPVRVQARQSGEAYAMVAEVFPGVPSGDLVRRWIAEGAGDLRFLRPVQWRLPTEPVVFESFRAAIAEGRDVYCVYPMEALRAARAILQDHADAGEQVRVLPEVPLQMALVGHERALIFSGLGDEGRTLLVEDPFLVSVFVQYFDVLWDRAVPMPDLGGGPARDDQRRMLLDQLASGRRDEQIARTMGLGLRTVRRRVADLMIELGAETRFQAGVEAVRRGWF